MEFMNSHKTYLRHYWFSQLKEILLSSDDFARMHAISYLTSAVACGFLSPQRSQSIVKILDRHIFLSEIPF